MRVGLFFSSEYTNFMSDFNHIYDSLIDINPETQMFLEEGYYYAAAEELYEEQEGDDAGRNISEEAYFEELDARMY